MDDIILLLSILIKKEDKFTVKGKLSLRDGELPSVLVDTITPWTKETPTENNVEVEVQKPKTLYLKYDLTDISLHNKIFSVLKSYLGTTPVIVKCSVTNKTFKLNVNVDASSFMVNELHAYIPDQFIKLC